MSFNPRDFLRLDVEAAATGLVNLAQNPNGDLGAWAYSTPLANTALVAQDSPVDGARVLRYTAVAGVNYFDTEFLPVTPGQYVAASYRLHQVDSAIGAVLKFRFWKADRTAVSDGPLTAFQTGTGAKSVPAVQVPATAAYATVNVALYASVGPNVNPAVGKRFYFRELTVAQAATAAALGSSFVNLLTNPRVQTNLTGWTSLAPTTITRVASGGGFKIVATRTTAGALEVYTETVAVQAGVSYVGSAPFGVNGIPKGLAIQWLTAAGALISETQVGGSAGVGLAVTGTAPVGATKARLAIRPGNVSANGTMEVYMPVGFATASDAASAPSFPFTGATPDTASWDYGWEGTADASRSTVKPIGVGLSYIAPAVYTDVADTALEIVCNRFPLDVGTLSAVVKDTALDPATADAIRPGRRQRLLAKDTTGTWRPVYNGRLDQANVDYDLKKKPSNQVRISLAALDANATLSNVKAPQGVGTIPALPYVLEGAGIPWDVDGSGNQVPAATVTSASDNTSVLDQVAITRDSALGYAWTDVRGVLRVRSDRAASYYTGEPYALTEADYTDLQVGFSTAEIINTLSVTLVRFNPTTGEPEEVPYGPFVDAASVREWGPRGPSSPVTIQGVADVPAWAAAVLAANAQPVRRVTSVTVPIRQAADVSDGKALLDLYAKVRVQNAAKAIDQTLRVTSIQHSIKARRWFLTLGFDSVSSVASPTEAPAVVSANPVGEQRGSVLITPSAANTPTMAPVVFTQPFPGVPSVITAMESSVPGTTVLGVGARDITRFGFNAVVTRTNTTNTVVHWSAEMKTQ